MYSASEKLAIIRLVEDSELSVRRTLIEINISRSSFYRWYQAYERVGPDGLHNHSRASRQHWNKIPESVRELVVDVALDQPELTPRELAWHLTDTHEYFISESSVYRILKAHDLVTSPQFIVMSAADTLKDALEATGLTEARMHHKPRLLSDNGPCYISKELREWLLDQDMKHTRGAPYHPMTQGKIERYHRSMKNVVKLEHYYFPWELENAIAEWVTHYNHERYHESLDNVTPADVYNGRRNEILDRRSMIKSRTLMQRKVQNLRLTG